jgi:protein involved in polysaccharide export with SLBB domain
MCWNTQRWALLVALAGACGCGGILSRPAPRQRIEELNRKQDTAEYRVGKGDELEVQFLYAPELNTKAVVRPDGRVSLPLIGDVLVLNTTPARLTEELKQRYGGRLPRAEVLVNVRGFAGQRVFIGGEVSHPGMQPLTGDMTVIQAIMSAQGFTDRALIDEVVVIRRGEGQERLVFAVNLDAAMSGRDAGQDITLQAADIVVVPRNGISNVNLWVDQYIRRNIPISAYVGYNVQLNNGPLR